MMQTSMSPTRRSIRRHLIAGTALVILLAGAVGGWSATTHLSGAVISSGALVVNSSVKKIQHPFGGVVGELLVREGDEVKAGDVLLRLDSTQARASSQIIVRQIDELLARQARGEAEQASLDRVVFPQELEARKGEPDLARTMAGEQRLFEIKTAARDGQKAQLAERMSQFQQEIDGLNEQVQSKDVQLDLISQELVGVEDLLKKKLVQFTRVTALQRDRARLMGERGQLVASIGETKGKISGTQLQIIQLDNDMRSDVAKELSDIRARLAELIERKIAAQDQLKRIDIRAPQDGTVHKLDVHTVGGVIRAGDLIMEIVPTGDELVVETKIPTQDINDVQIGQAATLRFSGIDQRTMPEINATVGMVSADITQDQRTGAPYYVARIMISKAEFDRLQGVRFIPGMPVETFIKTRERTALAYFTQPLADQIARAFREK